MTWRPAGLRSRLRGDLARTVLANCSARGLALLGLALATVMVARVGGPADVGAYALLRMLPGLVGVLCVGGLPGALGYFLAPSRREQQGLWPSLLLILAGGSVLGTFLWVAGAAVLAHTFFPRDQVAVIALAGGTVATQLLLTVGKTSLQGVQDRRGGDFVIAAEELSFLPAYALVLLLGGHGTVALIAGLALADVAVAVVAWRRVGKTLGWRRGGLARAPHGPWGRPDRGVVKEVLTYGVRGQVGGIVTLLNLRLDFALLGAMAGPAVLGTYAVASKYAELLRLPGTALTWVCYPTLASVPAPEAATRARRLVPSTLVAVAAAALPFALLAGPVTTLLYGDRFAAAVGPARVLIVGMVLSGAAGVASGYLYGRGRPGLNSVALGVGLAVTVVLDLVLIPRHGAMGAAVASTIAYLVGDAALLAMLAVRSRRDLHPAPPRLDHLEATS